MLGLGAPAPSPGKGMEDERSSEMPGRDDTDNG
jgi:hypothetical protein